MLHVTVQPLIHKTKGIEWLFYFRFLDKIGLKLVGLVMTEFSKNANTLETAIQKQYAVSPITPMLSMTLK